MSTACHPELADGPANTPRLAYRAPAVGVAQLPQNARVELDIVVALEA